VFSCQNKDPGIFRSIEHNHPQEIADLKGWKKGTELELKENAGYVCLVEVRN
jgi:hypothetical protein